MSVIIAVLLSAMVHAGLSNGLETSAEKDSSLHKTSVEMNEMKALLIQLLAHPEHSQGEMVGHMTENSAILQTRLTLTNQAFNHDYIGCPGWACFEYTDKPNRTKTTKTAWMEAKPGNDYIVKVKLEGLNPNSNYYYRLLYGLDTENYRTGHWCEFKTLPGKTIPGK